MIRIVSIAISKFINFLRNINICLFSSRVFNLTCQDKMRASPSWVKPFCCDYRFSYLTSLSTFHKIKNIQKIVKQISELGKIFTIIRNFIIKLSLAVSFFSRTKGLWAVHSQMAFLMGPSTASLISYSKPRKTAQGHLSTLLDIFCDREFYHLAL